jgi:hypothetical protein
MFNEVREEMYRLMRSPEIAGLIAEYSDEFQLEPVVVGVASL